MATASIPLAPPEPLKKKGNLGDNWTQWKQNFKIYLNAADIDQSSTKATAHFLHTIGQYGRDIFNDLEIPEDASLEEYFAKFDSYCNPRTNLTFNRYQFFDTKQEKNQPFDKFLLTLKQKSKNCEFGDLNESLIMTQIISGINNTHLRQRLLRMDLDLNSTIEECRSTEVSEAQAQKISAAKAEKSQGKPHAQAQQNTSAKAAAPPKFEKKQHTFAGNKNVKSEQDKGAPKWIANCNFCSGAHVYGNCPAMKNVKSEQDKQAVKWIVGCNFCGGSHAYANCPAFGTTCRKCQKPNHYAKVCKN